MLLRRSHRAPPIQGIAGIFLAARRFDFLSLRSFIWEKLPSDFFGHIFWFGFKKRFKKVEVVVAIASIRF